MVYSYQRTVNSEPLAYCDECKCELYEGETVYRVGERYFCEDCVMREELERDDYEGF